MLALSLVCLVVMSVSYLTARNVIQHDLDRLEASNRSISDLVLQSKLDRIRNLLELAALDSQTQQAIRAGNKDVIMDILLEIYFGQQEGVVDVLFIQTAGNRETIDVSTENYDLSRIRELITSFPTQDEDDNVYVAGQTSGIVYAVISRREIISPINGKLLGHVYGGMVLNGNTGLVRDIIKATGSISAAIFHGDRMLAHYPASAANMLFELGDVKSGQQFSERTEVVFDLLLPLKDVSGLPFHIRLSQPSEAVVELERNYQQAVLYMIGLVILAAVIAAWLLGQFAHRAMLPLTNYAREVHGNPSVVRFRPGAVQEFNEVGKTLEEFVLALRQSEDRFRNFAEKGADWFWEIGPDLRCTYLAGRYEEVLGLKREDLIGKTKMETLLDKGLEDSNGWRKYAEAVEDHREFNELEVIWTHKDGSEKTISLSAKRLSDEYGNFLGYRGVARDITRRRYAEIELRRLRNYLINIINSMPSALIGVDDLGHVTQWNSKAQLITGLQPDEALGQPLHLAFPRMSEEMVKVRAAIETRQEQTDHKRAFQEDGETFYEDVTIYPLEANGVSGAVVRIDDVTEQVRLEEMMIQSEKMLSVGGLAAGMAHEINNPLAGMMQTANVMTNRLTADEIPANREIAKEVGIDLSDLRDYLERRGIMRMLDAIRESGERVAGIVDNMLSFARKENAVTSSHSLNELVDKTLDLAATDFDLKKQYDFRAITLEKVYDTDLPEVPCEAAKIQQVLLNILRNGAEAMQEAGTEKPQFTIRTHKNRLRGHVTLEIEDNGPGMDENHRRRIFEPFFTTKPVGVGTGLGLSVSYFIVTENHGGEMVVDSEPGRGTTFLISLPMEGFRASA